MKIKYSALVSATSGKLNGSVAASNRGGAYLRNKGVTSNPQTVSQQANRSLFGSISSQFRSLTPEQINAWNVAAQDFPVIDRFGDTRYLSGLALFVQLNKNLADVGLPGIENPPAKQSFPAIATVNAVVNIGSDPQPTLLVELVGVDALTTGFTMLVRATQSVSPSVSFVKNKYRVLGSVATAAAPSVAFEEYPDYTALFGVPIVGQRVYFEAVLVSNVSGEKSAPFPVSTIVINVE